MSISIARTVRSYLPPRVSELITLGSLFGCCLLLLHTNNLNSRLQTFQRVPPEAPLDSQHVSNPELYEKVLQEREDGLLDISALNNSRHYDKLTLVFNRVPKVGSQSTMELLKALSHRNGFSFHKDKPQKAESIKLSLREQKRLVRLVDIFRPPSVYVKHVCYLNFTQFNYTQPLYLNMVRDPVERVISWYYYVRAPWYFVERKQAYPDLPLPSSKWLRKDYETCAASGDRECQYLEGDERPDFAQQSEFFCGQHKKCTGFNTQYALDAGRENVGRHYAVVGILEDLNMTLTVMEHYLPRFFRGARQTYWEHVKKFSSINKNIFKPKVADKIKNFVRKNFTREMRFYDFCKERLYRQYAALGLPEGYLVHGDPAGT